MMRSTRVAVHVKLAGVQVEAMLGKFSLDTMMKHGGQAAGLFMIVYLFTMIVTMLCPILIGYIFNDNDYL